MKFGLLFRPQDPPDAANIGQRWQEILAAGEAAEAAGWDGLFVPEHHMMPDAYLPSPVAGAWARWRRVTKRVDIGTTVHLLPFEHPVHVAEHSAMVDVLSGGRLKLGVGLGNFPSEFELFGLNPKTQVSRFEEAIEILQRLWAGETLDHSGKHFTVKGNLTPLPQSAELWMGAMSEPGIRRAARFGAPVAHRPAAQHRGHEGVEGHLRRGRRGVRHHRQAADGAAARRLGRGLDGRRRARLVAVHPRRALVLLLPDPALGARPRAAAAGRVLRGGLPLRQAPRRPPDRRLAPTTASPRSAPSRRRSASTT